MDDAEALDAVVAVVVVVAVDFVMAAAFVVVATEDEAADRAVIVAEVCADGCDAVEAVEMLDSSVAQCSLPFDVEADAVVFFSTIRRRPTCPLLDTMHLRLVMLLSVNSLFCSSLACLALLSVSLSSFARSRLTNTRS